jgi:hypothetical protein
MARGTFVMRNGQIVEKYGPLDVRLQPKLSDLPFPQVMSDTMDPVQSQVTGVYHTSKRAMRAEYKQHNVVEVGNDPARLRPYKKPRKSETAIRDTVEKAIAKYDRGERASI